MRLYLIRHGAAADASSCGGLDEDRPLTEKGREALTRLVRLVRAEEKAPAVIWTSPLVRAVQTAELVASLWGKGTMVRASRSLLGSADPADVLAEIEREAPDFPLALVGHEPHLGNLLTRITGAKDGLSLPKAAICRVRFNASYDPPGEFVRLYAPGLKKPLEKIEDMY